MVISSKGNHFNRISTNIYCIQRQCIKKRKLEIYFNIDPDFELVLWVLWVLQLLKVEMKQKRQTLHES